MAITIATDWTLQAEREIAPGNPIKVDDNGDDLETLIQRLHKIQAEDTKSILAQGGLGSTMGIDEATVTVATDRYHGVTSTWSASIRIRLHVLGADVDVGGTLGTVSLPTVTCGATRQWYSSAITRISGMTRGSSGATEVVISGMEADTAGTREHEWWILEEVADELAYLPDSSHASTSFQRVEDGAVDADGTLDGWLLGTIARNAREAQRVRSRGTAIVHPLADPPTFSSMYRRSDGPYLFDAAPWETEGLCIVRVAAKDYDVQVMAFTDSERGDFEALLATRAVTITVAQGEQTLVFDSMKFATTHGAMTPNRVYLHILSTIGAAAAYSPSALQRLAESYSRGDAWLSDGDWSTGEVLDWPVGRIVEFNSTPDDDKNYTVESPISRYDLVGNLIDSATKSEGAISPSLTRYPAPWDGEGTASAPSVQTVKCGIVKILSVYVGGHPPASDQLTSAAFRRACAVADLPPASVVEAARARCNEVTEFGSAQLATRLTGNHWLKPSEAVGTGTAVRHQSGRYGFVPMGAGGFVTVARCGVPSDPTSGTGLNVDAIMVEALVYIVRAAATIPVDRMDVEAKIVKTWNGGTASSATKTFTLPIYPAFYQHANQTLHDAARSAVIVARETGFDASDEAWEHAYTAQLTWGTEAFDGGVWDSIGLETVLPTTYPAMLELQLSGTLSGSSLWAVVPSFSAKYSSRR